MPLVAGIDTIVGLAGQPPAEIELDYDTVKKQQVLFSQWNGCFIALIPFCFKCKVALAWHTAPREEGHENEMFTCPNCGRVWVLGEKKK